MLTLIDTNILLRISDPATRFAWVIPVSIIGGLYLLQFVLLYIWVPLHQTKVNTLPIDPQFEEFDLGHMPPDVIDAFHNAARFLAALGFQAQGHLRKRQINTLVSDSFVSVWTHPGDGHIAQVIGVRAKRKDGAHKSTSLVTYRRELADGTKIVTTNGSSPRIYPLNLDVDSVVVAELQDLGRLYAFHLARVERLGRRPIRSLPERHNVVEYMDRDWNAEFEAKEAIGYQRRDVENGVWRPTVVGAFLMTWRMLRPWKQINFHLRDRKANRELREMGFGGLAKFRDMPAQSLGLALPPPLEFSGGGTVSNRPS